MQTISKQFIIKSIAGENVTIAGYASVYNVVDQQNDIIVKGAFSDSCNQLIKFLWQHDTVKPIGFIKSLHEDDYGLLIEAVIQGNIQYVREAIELIQQGLVRGLSIGFNLLSSHFNHLSQRIIDKAELLEVSVVTFPANIHAKIYNINNINNRQDNMNQQHQEDNYDAQQIHKQIRGLEDKFNNIQSILSRPEIGVLNNLECKDAFGDYIRKGNINTLIQKSFSNSANEGEVLVVPTLYHKIISEMNARSPMRQLASVETISTNALDVVIEDGRLAAGWVGEVEARTETKTSQLKQKRILVHELYAQPKATQNLIDDAAIQIENWLAERLRDSFVKAENEAFIIGKGIKQPKGILHPDHKLKTLECKGKLTDLLLDLINDLDESYLANATFLMNRATLSEIQKLKDSNERFIWQQAISESFPQTIFGIPVVCCAEMPLLGQDKLAIAFGDFKAAYKIVDRSSINIMRDPYTDKPFIKFYAVKRVGGDVVNPEALRLVKF